MKVTRSSEAELVVECPAVGEIFSGILGLFGLTMAVFAVFAGDGGIAAFIGGLIFACVGAYVYWVGGPSTLTLDSNSGYATVVRERPFGLPDTQSFLLTDIDDVTNARDAEGPGFGLVIELEDSTAIRVSDANHHNEEARSVGKQIRTWLKDRGIR